MARPASITQEDVESAVTALEDNGKPINPYQVRKLLSKGSIAKIGYFLKALGVDAVYEADDPLTARLALLLRPAALELEEQTDERIRKETEQLRNDIHERDVALADLESRLEEKQSLLEIQQKRLTQATVDGDWLKSEKQMSESQSYERQLATALSNSERLSSENTKLVSDLGFLKTLINKFEIPLTPETKDSPDS